MVTIESNGTITCTDCGRTITPVVLTGFTNAIHITWSCDCGKHYTVDVYGNDVTTHNITVDHG